MSIGKQWRGQKHAPIKTAEQAQEEITRGAEYATKPGAVMLDIYLTGKGVRDPIRLAMMKAHVPAGIVAAPPADWDKIFENF